MLEVVLYQPEIPPNTGNVLRLCANTGAQLHLVRPLGFRLGDRGLARAGLAYADISAVTVHDDWQACRRHFEGRRVFAFSAHAARSHAEPRFAAGDVLLFGSETRGLPAHVLQSVPEDRRIRLPMRASSRSLNLANAVAVAVYEAWRQLGFAGAQADGD